ncbi:MAG: glycosyltransferase [Bacteroidota bacterium]
MKANRKIWIALPAKDEAAWLPKTLNAIRSQSYSHYHLIICVNQEDHYHKSENNRLREIYHNNQKTLQWLHNMPHDRMTVLDCSSPGSGWPQGKGSVGLARKILMDTIAAKGQNKDIILSMDADTTFDTGYFASVNHIFSENTEIAALSNPYYHKLTGDNSKDKTILRYELYMRNYKINLHRIQSPYRFTALGSAMATTIEQYQKIGGMTAKKSGEDFYFLQKMVKSGPLYLFNHSLVYPAARYSSRVFFGTGPAMIKGNSGIWDSYPIYHADLFDQIRTTQQSYAQLFHKDINTPVDKIITNNQELWQKLRSNTSSEKQFIKACHQRIDGLRILQFLKSEHQNNKPETQTMLKNMEKNHIHCPEDIHTKLNEHSRFQDVPVKLLQTLRNILFEHEHNLDQQKPITTL